MDKQLRYIGKNLSESNYLEVIKPQTQTDDVKMQSIQNNIIKASINITKLLNQAGELLGTSNFELGTNALGLSGQANKLINNKRKVWHKNDLDNKYHYLTRERSGSVVECLTRDRRAASLSLTGATALWSLSKTHLS